MAQIVGRSACTTALLGELSRLGMRGLSSFADIEHFLRTSEARIREARSREERALRTRISELQASAQGAEQEVERLSPARRAQLTEELARLPLDLAGLQVQGARTPVAALRMWLRRLKMRLRLRTLSRHFEREVLRPYRRALREARRDRERAAEIERNLERSLDAAVAILVKAQSYLAHAGRRDYLGAIGEEQVLAELRSLSDDYVVFNDVTFRLEPGKRRDNHPKIPAYAQVDHVVLGYACVFLIETKNWGDSMRRKATVRPQYQLHQANKVANCLAWNALDKRRVTFRNLLVMLDDPSSVWFEQEFVRQVPLSGLVARIHKDDSETEDPKVTQAEAREWLWQVKSS